MLLAMTLILKDKKSFFEVPIRLNKFAKFDYSDEISTSDIIQQIGQRKIGTESPWTVDAWENDTCELSDFFASVDLKISENAMPDSDRKTYIRLVR